MPRAGQRSRGTGTNEARNVQNLQPSSQLSLSLDTISAEKPSKENHLKPVQHLSTSNVNLVMDGIKELAIERSEQSPKISRNAVNKLDRGFEHSICRPARSDSDSDDEVIIFSGRAKANFQRHGSELDTSLPTPKDRKDLKLAAQHVTLPTSKSVDGEAVVCKGSRVRRGRRKSQGTNNPRSAKQKRISQKMEDNAVIADYIANMRNTDGATDIVTFQQFQHRDLDFGASTGFSERFDADDEVDENKHDEDDWNSVDFQDFEGFSSSSEPMNAIPRILRRRLRKSGAQYLVVASGESLGEARWLSRNLLMAPAAADAIDVFEKEQFKMRNLTDDGDEGNRSSSLDTVGDDKDLRERSKARMSDEHIARLLSKQTELGLVGDDLVLFDGHGFDAEYSDNIPTIDIEKTPPHSLISGRKKKKRLNVGSLSRKARVDDRALDSHKGFNVMDSERLSLRNSARTGPAIERMLNLSDSDLRDSMITAWQSDRAKKKQRKQERESLRIQGLLGTIGKSDTRKQFGRDLAIDDIKREIKSFLESSAESCPLPPIGQRERKMIHELAHKSGLKSRSIGTGTSRFPILYRTSRTKALTPALEAQIDATFTSKNVLQRPDKLRRNGIPASRSGRKEMATAASYRDGEIVGVGAPELGTENRGRAILEKMGWSTGSSLGAPKNKGIAQPIEQIVKTSKAGLG